MFLAVVDSQAILAQFLAVRPLPMAISRAPSDNARTDLTSWRLIDVLVAEHVIADKAYDIDGIVATSPSAPRRSSYPKQIEANRSRTTSNFARSASRRILHQQAQAFSARGNPLRQSRTRLSRLHCGRIIHDLVAANVHTSYADSRWAGVCGCLRQRKTPVTSTRMIRFRPSFRLLGKRCGRQQQPDC